MFANEFVGLLITYLGGFLLFLGIAIGVWHIWLRTTVGKFDSDVSSLIII